MHFYNSASLARLPAVCRVVLLALLSAWACLAFAAPAAEAPARNLRFENLANSQVGVPNNSVISIAQDHQGFIWMGTQDGAYRYDGLRSAIFRNDPANAASLPGDFVSAIHRDASDRLWFGTNNGLARFDPATGEFLRYPPPADEEGVVQADFVRRIIGDGKDGLWLATARGLQHFDPASGKFVVYRHVAGRAESLASDQVYALAVDPKGGLWVGAWPVGLDYLPPGGREFRHFLIEESPGADPKLNSVQALALQGDTLWIGTAKGMLRWNTAKDWRERERLQAPAGAGDFSVYNFLADASGDLWIGTQPSGLMRHAAKDGRLTVYRHQPGDPNSLPSNRVSSLLIDRTGALWAGTWDSGVARTDLASEGFDRFVPAADEREPTPLSNVLGSMSQADATHIWLGGPAGVRLFDIRTRKTVRSYQHDPARPGSLPNNFVITLTQQPGGPLWVGTSSGLARLDHPDGPFREIRFAGKGLNFIRKIVPTRNGKLWMGSEGGLMHYDPVSGDVRVYRHNPQDKDSRAVDSAGPLFEDSRGRLWIGSNYGFGFDVLDVESGKFRHYRHDPRDPASLSNDFVRCFFEDANGVMWIGTANGLNRVRDEGGGNLRFTRYAEGQGLATHGVAAIRADLGGRLWLSMNGGISSLEPATGAVRNYAAADGITAGNFVSDASVADVDGTLYFGSFRGMTMVRPDAVRTNRIAPPVAVTSLAVLNQPLTRKLPDNVRLEGSLTEPRHLSLSWNDAMFSVEFAAMHFADPARNRYAYKLEGFDRDWIQADAAHRTATYTNLDPGSYRFRLKAANKNGVWNEQGLSFDVTIRPPFWATWWFRSLAFIFFVANMVVLFRWRLRSLEKNQRRLAALVEERTRELANKNTALSQAHDALENLSVTDPLTGLRNRRFIDQKMPGDVSVALRRYETAGAATLTDAALIFYLIDLDHFKQVNDRYGHAAGDQVLVEIRRRLEMVFRETDYLVRWGGEEFLVVAHGANPANAAEIADRLRSVVEGEPMLIEGGERLRQTCSIGYACYPFAPRQPRLLSWQQVLKLADLAMYAAKRSGRAAWVGMASGSTALDAAAVQVLLSDPAAALEAGILEVEASVSREITLAAWKSMSETEAASSR